MRLTTEPGEKVLFTGKNGTDYDQAVAQSLLTIGEVYTVRALNVGNWHSEVFFEGLFVGFNSVMFDNFYT